MMARHKNPNDFTEEERLEAVRAIDAYRAAHPQEALLESLPKAGRLTQSQYYSWRSDFAKRGLLEPLPGSAVQSRAGKRGGKAKAAKDRAAKLRAARAKTNGAEAPAMEFPLAIIPERAPPTRSPRRVAAIELVPQPNERGKLAAFLRSLADLLT